MGDNYDYHIPSSVSLIELLNTFVFISDRKNPSFNKKEKAGTTVPAFIYLLYAISLI